MKTSEERKQYKKEWYEQNKKTILPRQKAYRENPETEYNKKRRENYDPVKKREENMRYLAKNKDEANRRRRLRRKGIDPFNDEGVLID